MGFEHNDSIDAKKNININPEIINEGEASENERVIEDFENAFLAGFMHYKSKPLNRFPGVARLLYISLYKPEELQKTMGADIGAQEKRFETRVREMEKISKYANLENIPTAKEFELAVRQALKHGAEVSVIDSERGKISHSKEEMPSFEDALYPDVSTAMSELWNKYNAQIVIWTAGDSSPWKGQFFKVLNASHTMRQDKIFGSAKDKGDMFSIVAENFKMDHLADIFRNFKKRGVDKIIFVEDRLSNLKEGMSIAHNSGVSCIPAWVRREGNEFAISYAERDIDESKKAFYQEEYNAVKSFADVQKVLEQKELIRDGETIGMVIDFDGVLSDVSLTNRIWTKSIVNTLIINKWIKNHEEK